MLKTLLNKFFSFFRRKPIPQIEIELKKYPKKERKRLRALWEQWEQGKYIKIEENNGKILR